MYKKKLLELGIPADIKGFTYLNYSIKEYNPLQGVMKLYKDVAIHYDDTYTKVERAMRHAIKFTDEKKLSVGRFIAKYKVLWEDDNL